MAAIFLRWEVEVVHVKRYSVFSVRGILATTEENAQHEAHRIACLEPFENYRIKANERRLAPDQLGSPWEPLLG